MKIFKKIVDLQWFKIMVIIELFVNPKNEIH